MVCRDKISRPEAGSRKSSGSSDDGVASDGGLLVKRQAIAGKWIIPVMSECEALYFVMSIEGMSVCIRSREQPSIKSISGHTASSVCSG